MISRLSDLLRQLHLCVEAAVLAEHQASRDYENELWDRIVDEHLPRIVEMVRERRQRP